tara:strand:- start:45798 stop:46496 length:699 start_codon:yes stop_codon:yes gene_type:complete
MLYKHLFKEKFMSRLYQESHRALQDEFGTRKLADRVEAFVCLAEFSKEAKQFIENLDFFFLSTVDSRGRPTVSYKGGDVGFVRITDSKTLIFPIYNGNGMYYSAGNIQENSEVGLLFMSFEKPHRIRVQGKAQLNKESKYTDLFPGSEMVVTVALSEFWQNCPRYIHKYQKVRQSKNVPDAAGKFPLATWKRIDGIQDVLSAGDQRLASEAGLITAEEWQLKVESGADDASA